MSGPTTLEDLNGQDGSSAKRQPYFAVKDKSDEELLKWLNQELEYIKKQDQDRIRKIKNNLARIKGIQYQAQDTRGSNRDRDNQKSKFSPKMVMNLIDDVTEQKVARLIEYKPAVAVLPTNDEFSDKVAAITGKRFLNHINYTQDLDDKTHQMIRYSKQMGDAVMTVMWNEEAGGVDPDWDPKKPEEYKDEKGEAVRDSDGKKKMLDRPVFNGGIEYKIWLPMYVFMERAESAEKTNHCFLMETEYTEGLKLDYPSKAGKIKEDADGQFYDFEKFTEEPLDCKTIVYTFVYRKTKYCPKGAIIRFTKDVILKKSDGPDYCDFGEWPITVLPDKVLTGENRGESYLQNIKGPASQYNNSTNMIIRNQMLVSHPKWFVWGGSVNKKALNNDISIVNVKGPKAPVLAQANPTPNEVFEFRKELKQEIYDLAQIPSVQSGDLPKGIKAMVALQFITEQEARRQNPDITRLNKWVREVNDKALKVAAKKIATDKQKTIMIMGKSNTWYSKNIDPKKLARPFEVRIQNQSALPESKGARMQFILDMAERFEDLFPKETIVEMLDMGQVDKFMDEASNASRSAEFENECILEGEECGAPEEWEFHIIHWRTHVRSIQDVAFKKNTPENIKKAMIDHIKAHEMFMLKEANKSIAFAKSLEALPQFPMFFEAKTPKNPENLVPPGGEPGAPAILPTDILPPEGLPPDPALTPDPNIEPQPIDPLATTPQDPSLL